MNKSITPALALCMFFEIILLACSSSQAQSVYAPLNSDYYHLVERYEIKQGRFAEQLHSQMKPYLRRSIAALADSLSDEAGLSEIDRFNLNYLRSDNWEWSEKADNDRQKPVLKYFFNKKSDFFQYQQEDFDLHVNPVLHFGLGRDQNEQLSRNTYLNTRGVEIRGMIDRKLGFYTYLTDTQAGFPLYVQNQIKAFDAVPGEGYYKDGDRAMPTDVDFLTARGYISFDATKHIQMQFGHDRHFIGNGYRSMILSDYASNYLFLKVNTQVWKLNYQNIFAQMNAEVLNADGFRPKKYFAFHHLSTNITPNFNIGVFEAIVFAPRDTIANSGFDLNYLNPIIFYRSVEQQLGSPDNALLGIDFRWNFLKRFQLYGQLNIDELQVREVLSGNGWWGNKQAGQIGLKYIDAFGISNLDLQGEVNIARPYTYTQNNKFTNYAHYQQPLAHPLGANFYESIGIIRYQPLARLQLTGKLIYIRYGADAEGSNWGGNIFLDNRRIEQLFGNRIGQGIEESILFGDFTASYQVFHNFFLDFKQVLRRQQSEIAERNLNTSFTSLSIRWNIPQRLHEF
jgi:hypothetical protein